MNKLKQIWAILFPNGFYFTYGPAMLCFTYSVFALCSCYVMNGGDLLMFINFGTLALSFRFFYTTYQYRKVKRAHEAMMVEVFNTVRPELQALFHRYMIDGEGDLQALALMGQESHEIISREVHRRRNHSRVPKPDKL